MNCATGIHIEPVSTVQRKNRENVNLVSAALDELGIKYKLHQLVYTNKQGKTHSGEIIFDARTTPQRAEWLYEAASRQIGHTQGTIAEFLSRSDERLHGPLTQNLQALVEINDYTSVQRPWMKTHPQKWFDPQAHSGPWNAEIRIIPIEKWWRRTPEDIYIGVTED